MTISQSEALGFDRNPPAITFEKVKDTAVGTVVSVTARLASKYGKPNVVDTWPDGRPKYELVIILQDGDEGEQGTLYARNLLLKAISDAVAAADSTELAIGSKLTVTYTGDSEGKPGQNPAKLYSAQYAPAE